MRPRAVRTGLAAVRGLTVPVRVLVRAGVVAFLALAARAVMVFENGRFAFFAVSGFRSDIATIVSVALKLLIAGPAADNLAMIFL